MSKREACMYTRVCACVCVLVSMCSSQHTRREGANQNHVHRYACVCVYVYLRVAHNMPEESEQHELHDSLFDGVSDTCSDSHYLS